MSSAKPPIPPMLMELHATLVHRLHDELPGAGFPEVRPPHCQVLALIGNRGSRLTDLAAAAQMTKQSMGALVDHLEQAGYVERVPDARDARVRLIRKTKRGADAATAVAELGARIERDWAARIGTQRLDQLRASLAQMIDR